MAIEQTDSEEETSMPEEEEGNAGNGMRPWRVAKHTVQQAQVPEVPQIRSLSQLSALNTRFGVVE